MNKTEDKRTAILDRLADHVLSAGLIASSLRPLAKAAGTSDRMLLYYFADKNEMITATLQHIAARLTVIVAARLAPEPLPHDHLRDRIMPLIADETLWPYMRIWLDVASRAAHGDALMAQIGRMVGVAFLDWITAQLASDDPEHDAARLLVLIEGTIFLRAVGLADVCVEAVRPSPRSG